MFQSGRFRMALCPESGAPNGCRRRYGLNMATSKTVDGIRYSIRKRQDAGITESAYVWVARDGSEIDATEAEDAAMFTSRSITEQ